MEVENHPKSNDKESWLLRKKKSLKFLFRNRTWILKKSRLLGTKTANVFIDFGYQIKNSEFFHHAAVQIEASRKDFYNIIIKENSLEQQEIVYLEFGVYKGDSFKFWLENNYNLDSLFFGFDTFSGLPEEWGHIPKGHFDTKGVVPIFEDERYIFFPGLFQNTVPVFVNSNNELLKKKIVVNLDADLYSSTLYVLTTIKKFLKPGDVLIFDEFFSIVNASTEFRAFLDFISISGVKVKAISKTAIQCAFVVL